MPYPGMYSRSFYHDVSRLFEALGELRQGGFVGVFSTVRRQVLHTP
jgi:hypothetical protein